jgi:hypothetical protein
LGDIPRAEGEGSPLVWGRSAVGRHVSFWKRGMLSTDFETDKRMKTDLVACGEVVRVNYEAEDRHLKTKIPRMRGI